LRSGKIAVQQADVKRQPEHRDLSGEILSGSGNPARSNRTVLLITQGALKCTCARRSGKSVINGHRSTSPFRSASSELVPVSTQTNFTPARRAAAFTISTARPLKPEAARIWNGGFGSKPMRRGLFGTGGIQLERYQ
jgi:hypothetical protein